MLKLDADRRVSTDLNCLVCGYNVRSLRTAGRCSECGSPVVWAAHGSELLVADPSWLGRVCRGQGLVTLSFLWGWCPLAWPVFILGVLRLTTPAPRDAPALQGLAAPTVLRLSLLLLPILYLPLAIASWQSDSIAGGETLLDCYAAASFLAAAHGQSLLAWCVFRLLRRSATLKFRIACGVAACLSLLSLALVGLGWFVPRSVAWAPATGVALELLALPMFMIVMCSGWRLLDALQYQSAAVRQEIRAWDRFRAVREDERGPASPPGASTSASRV